MFKVSAQFVLESQRFKAVRLKQDGDPFESWQRQVQSLQMFFLCQSHLRLERGHAVFGTGRLRDFVEFTRCLRLPSTEAR